jgi:hypothetical protein
MIRLCAVAVWLILSSATLSHTSDASSIGDFDTSQCKSTFAAHDYASAAKECRSEAAAILNALKQSQLTGDSRADALGIAAIQMLLASVAQSRDRISSDAAQAANSLNEAKRLINQALKSCTSATCRDKMEREAERIDSWQDSTS